MKSSIIEAVPLVSSSQDLSVVEGIQFLIQKRHTKSEFLEFYCQSTAEGDSACPNLLTWVLNTKWQGILLNKNSAKSQIYSVERKNFEIALFSQICQELKSGDLCIPGSDQFSDYRSQLISWEEYRSGIDAYAEKVGISINPQDFIKNFQTQLEERAAEVDRFFPNNDAIRIEKGELF